MGISKLPENGHMRILPRPQERKTGVTTHAKHAVSDKLSARSVALKHGISQEEPLKKIKNHKSTSPKTRPSKSTSSDGSYADPSMRWDSKDILTGNNFRALAKERFEKERPYCFAVAISANEKTSQKKKLFLDGSELFRSIDPDTFKIPCSVTLGAGKEEEFLHDVQFFAARENKQIERICTIGEATHGPDRMILTNLIRQEDNDTYESVGEVTNVLIASAYFLGIGVGKDWEYAKTIISKLDKEDKAEISPDLFSFALGSGRDALLTEFLLDNGFDPSVRDPYELGTSIQMADYYRNKEMLLLFERYGYHLES